MDTTRVRTGAAPSPDRRLDRASIDARLWTLPIAAAWRIAVGGQAGRVARERATMRAMSARPGA